MQFALGIALFMVGLHTAGPEDLASGGVVQVVSAATFDVNVGGTTERVHLVGIDDSSGPAQAQTAACVAPAALARAHALMDAQTVQVETDAQVDAYDPLGRRVAYIGLPDGRDLGEVLLGEGLVKSELTAGPYARQASYAAAQAAAVSAGVGYWTPDACAPAEPPQRADLLVASMLDQVQVANTALNALHQQTLSATAHPTALTQPRWQQGTGYALAELRQAGASLQRAAAPTGDLQPLAQRLQAVGTDLTASTDAYSLGVDRQDAEQVAATDKQLQATAAALQPLLQELMAAAVRYPLAD